jgi:predicted ATPase
VPATIRTLIAARLDGLPSGEKRVLQDAAVCGEAAWDRLLEAMSGTEDIQPVLKRLVQRGLLRQRPYSPVPGAEEYGFRHVLIREVAYDSIPRRDRSDLHLRAPPWPRSPWPSWPTTTSRPGD